MHFCVGFGFAYPRLVGMREPDARDRQEVRFPRFFYMFFISLVVVVLVNYGVLGIGTF